MPVSRDVRPLRLSDRILTILLVEGPKTHPELAELLGTTLGCVRTTNNFNKSMGFIKSIGKAKNRAAGDVQFKINQAGIDRLKDQTFYLCKEICRLANQKVKT